ncbi:MAG: YceI family protein [Mariprofundaceae bacterium]|nr:YceI family protein [Mariprofundaceae bacterium]
MNKWIIAALFLLPSVAWAGEMHADTAWQLDQQRSTLNFVSIKKGHVGEVHQFDRISGEISGNTAQLDIDLSSVNTGIAIRNKRMQKHLFNVGRFTTATVTLTLDPALTTMKKGTMKRIKQAIQLNLHGVTKSMNASLLIIAMNDGLIVTTVKPIMLHAADFSLTAGIEQLRNLAKLPSIASVVPVTLQLYFKRP